MAAQRPKGRPAARGRLHPGNTLNDLTGSEWVQATKSWFVCDGCRTPPGDGVEAHPASFPPELAERLIRLFTKQGATVLDPFAGTGSTLVACAATGRRGIGVELMAPYVEAARRRLDAECRPPHRDRQQLIEGDARELLSLVREPVDLCLTSPPYWDMLHHSRGGVISAHRRRAARGLDTRYSSDNRDLGNVADYAGYLEAVEGVCRQVAELLRPGKHVVLVAQNVRVRTGEMVPVAWDLAQRLGRFLLLQQELVWCQDQKPLGCWGYPTTYVSNVHHHYCLVLRKAKDGPPDGGAA